MEHVRIMDAESLILLVEIVDAGNLSAAARRLKMTRANVSYHLNRMEKALGQQLVRRTTRSIEPTDVGLRLYEHGRNIRNELVEAQESVRELGHLLRGRIRLSVPSGFGQAVLAGWLIDFKRLYPGIVLDVVFENHIADMLREEVDISIRVITHPPQNLVARFLAPVRHVACASVEYARAHGMPATLEDLPRVPILTANVSGRQLRLSAYQGDIRQLILLEPTLISQNFQFLHQAILAGLGVGIVPDYVIEDDVRAGRAVTTLDDWELSIFGTKMYLLYMPNRYQTRSTSTFIDYILDRARENQ
jgi:DNA-binding transcriptional LysR family regulator